MFDLKHMKNGGIWNIFLVKQQEDEQDVRNTQYYPGIVQLVYEWNEVGTKKVYCEGFAHASRINKQNIGNRFKKNSNFFI